MTDPILDALMHAYRDCPPERLHAQRLVVADRLEELGDVRDDVARKYVVEQGEGIARQLTFLGFLVIPNRLGKATPVHNPALLRGADNAILEERAEEATRVRMLEAFPELTPKHWRLPVVVLYDIWQAMLDLRQPSSADIARIEAHYDKHAERFQRLDVSKDELVRGFQLAGISAAEFLCEDLISSDRDH